MMMWIWSGLMLITLLFEVLTAGNLVSIWFTIGAFVALILAILNVHYLIQIIVFAVISGICILLFRPLAYNYLRGNIIATNADRIIGQHVRLTKAILDDHWGEATYNGVTWSCASYNNVGISEGVLVTVLAIEGAKLIVKAID